MEHTMTRSYKTSYKTHRNSARFAVTFDAPQVAQAVKEVCTICNGKIEESPMMRGVCYSCYQNLVQSSVFISEKALATQIVLDNSFTPEIEPWNVIPESVTVTKYDPAMALHGYAFNARRLEQENEMRKELHRVYNNMFK